MTQSATATPDPDTQGTPQASAAPVVPVTEGGLGDTLNQIMQERVYTGHPADDVGDAGEGNNSPGDDGHGEKSTEAVAPEGAPATATPATEQPAAEPPKFKHKTWEETEKARKEAERLAHDKSERAARAEEEAERLREENAELKKKATTAPPEPPKLDGIIDRYAQALAKTNELDQYDPDYHKNVAKIMVEAGFAGHAAPDQTTLQAMIDERVEAKVQEAVKSVKADTSKADSEARIITRANQLAADHGLDMHEDSPDYKAFWHLAKNAPRDIPFEEQTKWAADEVKALKGAFRQGYKEEAKIGEAHQTQNAVLERGGTPPPPAAQKVEPFSINSILTQTARKI